MNKSWNNTSLMTYIEIMDNINSEEDNTFLLLSIIFDISILDIEEMNIDKVQEMIKESLYIHSPVVTSKTYKKKITLRNEGFHLMEFGKMEFGAFIDLEILFYGDYLKNLPKILSILYRREITPGDVFNKPLYEEYGDWLDIRDSIFEEVMIGDVFNVIIDYLKFKSSIYSIYEGLFQQNEEELNEEEETELLREMTGKEREEYYNEKNVEGYGWELMLMRLANNDPTKMLEASKMTLYQSLNTLGMMCKLKIG